MKKNELIPVILFTYNRPDHLRRTLECLRQNRIPLIYAFSDSPRTPETENTVAEVRQILRAVDWCEIILAEREKNLGLGRSVLTGVSEVLKEHASVIVFEDDLICVPGTYQYLCTALEHYKEDPRVMSVTGWTHPSVIPSNVNDQPYFDGRAECWAWGTWARAWNGMDRDARTLMRACSARGIDVYRYGADLPAMAIAEKRKNIWAVRFLYLHMLNRGLCLRPPYSMVDHIGFDGQATNAGGETIWANPGLKPCPPIPDTWPEPAENPECPLLWQRFYGTGNIKPDFIARVRNFKKIIGRNIPIESYEKSKETINLKEFIELFIPPILLELYRSLRSVSSLRATRESEWEYVPDGWAYQETHPEVKGWNVKEILATNIQKWRKFEAMVQGNGPLGIAHESNLITNEDISDHNTIISFAYAITLAARQKDTLSFLDWGGGIGHYFLLGKALLPGVKIDYHCKDVPLLAEYGAGLFPDQHFYWDETCLERTYDFVMASTSLHYTQNWQGILKKLARSSKDYVYITRLPTVDRTSSFVFIQRPYQYGYNTEYLGWCLNRSTFLEESEKCRLKLLREFVIGERPRITSAPEQCQYRGFLFQV